MSRHDINVIRCGVLVALMFCTSFTRAGEPIVQVVRVPDGGIYPQVQTDTQGRVHLIYFKGDPRHGDIFYVRSDNDGATFTAPIRVNSQPESAIVIGTIRGPHLSIGRFDRPHVAWMGSEKAEPKVNGKSAPMLYTRLASAGDAFEPQRNIIQKHSGLDGGGSVAADRDGNVYVAWHAPESGDGEQDRQVWIARSRDDGATFDDESAAIPRKTGVCGCCGLNIIAADNGRVFIVFRSASEMVHRDIYLLASTNSGKTFKIIATDPWKVAKCVMSTVAFARSGDEILAAWETQEQIRLAALNPDGSATDSISMPRAGTNRKHASIAVNSRGEFLVAWTEGTGWNTGGTVVWQVFNEERQPVVGQSGRFDGLPPWSVPAVFAAQDGSFKAIY